jgi:hypothetical protein
VTILIALLGAVLGAAAGAVATYVTTRSTMRLELEHAYDTALRDRRLESYQSLFSISKCIPRYWLPDEAPTSTDLQRFRQEFHDWYFGDVAGGMFLTPAAKEELRHQLAEDIGAANPLRLRWTRRPVTVSPPPPVSN